MKKTTYIVIVVLLWFSTVTSALAEQKSVETPFSYNLNALVFGNAQYPSHTTQNPDNAFLGLYHYSTELDLRPDFYWEQPEVSALFKPRFTTTQSWGEDGEMRSRNDRTSRAFVNEWRVQANPLERVFVSFGKEKLLWGPSFIASPSNILFKDTEKLNPKTEVEGKYFAKAIYVPNNAVTVNFITETEEQKNAMDETQRPIQAIKTDVVGSDYQISVIGYYRQLDRFRIGSYGQWTASDAIILYYDGIVSPGTDALYPVPDPTSPFGVSLAKKYDDSNRLFTTATVGGSYTYLAGPTLNIEFLYNGQGCDDQQAKGYYALRRNAGNLFFDASPLAGLSQMTLNETFNTGLPFLRRYYVMGQVQVREIKNVLDVYLRYTHGLEEHAGQVSTIVEWNIANHVSLFNINSAGVGRNDTEFTSLVDRSAMLGLEMHF
jgi:hypothetical protein